ncbi:MAG: group III truncated hemoglobin [Bacteroidota bacterium]|nr:group III truncated hemoglobin [Bacteroidota bacterium]
MADTATLPDIQTARDVQALVDAFYHKANQDDLLAPAFRAAAHVYWPRHLTSFYEFWSTELLSTLPTLTPRPVPAHLALPRSTPHHNRWVQLFDAAVEERFAGQRAGHAKSVARQVAAALVEGMLHYHPLPVD